MKRAITAITLYFLLALAILQNWLFAAVLLIIIFSYQFGGASLIPLAFLIDGYFGNFESVPYLSIFSVVWYLLVEYVRPKVARLGDTDL
ncbi:hypothetical protein KC902_02085 [Candidatus Kaiserbacteria bacterium]|nr:hypothetical protein [Candidatus Kaiserbacteria bacterium]USN88813.1 MAG: hypothetical protein H6780_00095 [Candidatus Nomurabacteria bacterium]